MRAMRLKAALVVLLVAACGDSGGSAAELLPDLVQSPPRALEVYQARDTWRLAFLSAVENDGRGPMLLVGSRPDQSARAMTVEQLVRRSDGSTTTNDVDGEIRFVQSETHRHWHFLDFERYDILTADGDTIGRDQKTGFCLGDRYNASRSVKLPGEPAQPVWTQECGRGQPERLIIREGISPGYGDDYVPRLEGQWIDITGLPAGRYALRHRVNFDRVLRESDYGNNSAETPFDLTWSDSGTPTMVAVYQG
jgi:Lysyl oxidase